MASYGNIKEKLSSALQSKETIIFLKNILNYNGFGLSNATPNLNRFLYELPKSDNDIEIIDSGNRKKINNDIKIYNKKILVRTNSISANHISFKFFKYEKEDEIDFGNVMNVVNEKLDFYNYIFLIRIEEDDNEKQIKACYYYYLFPTEIFKIKKVEKINFDKYKRKASLSSEYWTFRSFSSFYLKYSDELLKLYNISPPFINC